METAILIFTVLTFLADLSILVILIPGALNDFEKWRQRRRS